jgi:hypothetical protein
MPCDLATQLFTTKQQKKGAFVMPLQITISKSVAGETTYAGSIIARTPFAATVKMLNANGSVNTSFNGTVNLYANSPTDDKAFSIGTANLVSGSAIAYNLVISRVYNLGASRKITAVYSSGGGGNETSLYVGVWFKGDVSCYNDAGQYCDSQGTRPTNYIALPGPASSLCNQSVRVYNPHSSLSANGKVWDVGPFFDANCCNDDEYWHTGTVPKSQTYKDQDRYDVCGPSCPHKTITGAIIDISEAMRNSLGASGTITNAYWRFA